MIFILGLDGLDADLVEKWGLQGLQQKEHGRIKVPVDPEYGVPYSPTVWLQFLTGKNVMPRKNGRLLQKLRSKVPDRMARFGLKRKIVKPPCKFPKLKHKTFLDDADCIMVNVPYYNYHNEEYTVLRDLENQTISRYVAKYMLHNVYCNINIRIAQSIKPCRIFFGYMPFPDLIQHVSYTEINDIKHHYMNLDRRTRELKEQVGDDSTFLIVSDHGFNFATNHHSRTGFYSCNKTLNPMPEQITDFYGLMV